MSERHVLNPGLVTFAVGEGEGATEFQLDVVEALRKVQAVSAEAREKQWSNFEHLDRLADWVFEKAGVRLTPGQADSLWRGVQDAYEVFSRPHAGSLNGVPRSPSSTASTPPA